MLHPGDVLRGHDRDKFQTAYQAAEFGTRVAGHDEDVALVQQLLGFIMYGMIDAQDVGVKVIRGETVFSVGLLRVGVIHPLHPSVLVVQQVAVDLVSELTREWEVWARRWRLRCLAHGES